LDAEEDEDRLLAVIPKPVKMKPIYKKQAVKRKRVVKPSTSAKKDTQDQEEEETMDVSISDSDNDTNANNNSDRTKDKDKDDQEW